MGDARVEGAGDDAVGGGVFDEVCKGVGGGYFHALGNLGGSDGEGAFEDAGEGEGVVDLVREVGAAGGYDEGSSLSSDVGHDFGGGVGEGKDYWFLIHELDVLGREEIGFGDADKNVGFG